MAKRQPERDLPTTAEAFDRWQEQQEELWEFIGGELVMMAEPALNHTIIKDNIVVALTLALGGRPCRVYGEGVRIEAGSLRARPDVTVSCAPIDRSTPRIGSPTLIVEVMSPTTEGADSRKWRAYRLLPSLQHFLTVSQEEREATLHTRVAPFEWQERVIQEGPIELRALGVTLDLAAVYADTDVPPAGFGPAFEE